MGKHDRFGKRNGVARVMNDMGLAAWFGGSLIDAVAPGDETGRSRLAVVETAAMSAYAIGGLFITKDNRARIAAQQGVAPTAATKAALSGLAMAATAYAAVMGSKVADLDEESDEASAAVRRLTVARWAVPVLTGAIIVVDAQLSEQQRPAQVISGVLQRMNPAA